MAVILFRPDGTIVEANPAFQAAMGYSLNELVGKHHRMFCAPEYAASPEYKQFWQRLGRGETFSDKFQRYKKMAAKCGWRRIIFRSSVKITT